MIMERVPNPLVAELANDLAPVRTLKLRDGLALALLALVVTVLLVQLAEGLWMTGMSGHASPFFYIGNGLLLALGAAAAVAVVSMSSPRVGNRYEGPKWAMATAAVLPVAALVNLLAQPGGPTAYHDQHGVYCLFAGLVCSLLVTTALVLWLRRGAPVSTGTAGLLTGVAATALGSAAYGLSCPIDDVMHIGLWHAAPVLVGAIAGRVLLPPMLRW